MRAHPRFRAHRSQATSLAFALILILAVLCVSGRCAATAGDIPLETSVPEEEPGLPSESYCTGQPDDTGEPAAEVVETLMAVILLHIEDEEQLASARELGLEVPGMGDHECTVESAFLDSIRGAGLRFSVTANAIRATVSSPAGSKATDYLTCGNQTDVDIPGPDLELDCPHYSIMARSGCSISGAPWYADVTRVDYRIRVQYSRVGNLKIYISSGYDLFEYIVWDKEGGDNDWGRDDDAAYDDDVYLYRMIPDFFDGEPVNQRWSLDVCDCGYYFEDGYIDYMEVWVYWDVGECHISPTELTIHSNGRESEIGTFTIANMDGGRLYGALHWDTWRLDVDPWLYNLGPNESQTHTVEYHGGECGETRTVVIDTGTPCEDAGDVVVTVIMDLPECYVGSSSLHFTCPRIGDTRQNYVWLANRGCGEIDGQITWDNDEFEVEPLSFHLGPKYSGTAYLKVTYTPVDCGDDVCTIDTHSSCGTISCTATGPYLPVCAIDPPRLNLSVDGAGGVDVETFTVVNEGCGALAGDVTSSCPDVTVDPSTIDIPIGGSQEFTVTFNPHELGTGTCAIDLAGSCSVPCDWECVNIWYVAQGGSNWTGDGSPQNPYRTIQCGVNHAAPGEVVKLAPGTYLHQCPIRHKSGVILRGPDPLRGAAVVDAQGQGHVLECRNVENAILENLTITGGSRSGIYAYGASFTMRNCRIENNSIRTTGGGGITCQHGSATLEDCIFTGNRTTYYGGGIYSYKSTLSLTGCTFSGNTAGRDGGALYLKKGTADVGGCHFLENEADDGGGIYSAWSALNLDHSVLWANSANSGGGLCATGTPLALSSCTFAANRATVGAGVHLNGHGATEIWRSIFASNGPGSWCQFPGGDPAFFCCDVYGNKQGDWVGSLAGQGAQYYNYCTDPCFCDLGGGDCHLAAGSPCAADPLCGPIGALGVGCSGPPPAPSAMPPQAVALGESATRFHLGPAVPNPFNPVTEISYGIPDGSTPSRVTLIVYNALGQQVRTLVDEERAGGIHSVAWEGKDDDGVDVASGVYFYRICWNGKSQTRRMVLLK